MLKLVATTPLNRFGANKGRVPVKSAPLHCVALLQLEPEFERYLTSHLRVHWPAIKILVACRVEELLAGNTELPQLIVCSIAPKHTPVVPTLWLSELARRTPLLRGGVEAKVVEICPKLWKTPMPITGRDLMSAINETLIKSSSQKTTPG